jgi:GNAT superfamily N-acetyltransferase
VHPGVPARNITLKDLHRGDAVQVRQARHDDFDAVMNLYRQLQPDDPVLKDGRDKDVFESILSSGMLHLFLLEDDSENIVASCYLNIIPNITRAASPYAIIENVITEQTQREKGLGKRLMAEVLEFAWSHGCYKAMLQTGSSRAGTHAFYRACGFSATNKTGYVARPA